MNPANRTIPALLAALCLAAAACTPTPQALAPTPTATPAPTPIVSSTGYRPLQTGDQLEGATINYFYVLPSIDNPVVDLAFGQSLMQLISVKVELTDGLAGYFRDIAAEPKPVLAFDEADPAQTEPRLLSWSAAQPIEVVFISLAEGAHSWSVTETQESEVMSAYKLVRRTDGGLRFIAAYNPMAVNSFTILATRNGTGAGLVFSARLALLRTILADPAYQHGENPFILKPPTSAQYDPRVLTLDASRVGLDQNVDWALVSRPGPNTGIQAY
jgi:hypothetical protein